MVEDQLVVQRLIENLIVDLLCFFSSFGTFDIVEFIVNRGRIILNMPSDTYQSTTLVEGNDDTLDVFFFWVKFILYVLYILYLRTLQSFKHR